MFLAGGWGYEVLSSTERFDPVSETFTPSADLAGARDGCTAVALADGRVLVVGGYNKTYLKSAEISN